LVLQNFISFVSKRKGNTTFSALDPHLKNLLAYNVYAAVRENSNGRFLQRLYKDAVPPRKLDQMTIVHEGTENGRAVVFVEVPEKQAMEKIKQSFRFLSDQKAERKQMKAAKKAAKDSAQNAANATTTVDGNDTTTSALKKNDILQRPPVVLRKTDIDGKASALATAASAVVAAPTMSAASLLFPQHPFQLPQNHLLLSAGGSAVPASLRSALLLNSSTPSAAMALQKQLQWHQQQQQQQQELNKVAAAARAYEQGIAMAQEEVRMSQIRELLLRQKLLELRRYGQDGPAGGVPITTPATVMSNAGALNLLPPTSTGGYHPLLNFPTLRIPDGRR
jgi:hypothetical protein